MKSEIQEYVNQFKKHYRYSPTNLGKIERIENYILNLLERIAYLERSNNRREDTILGLRNELSVIDDLEIWIKWKIQHCVDFECFPEETLDKIKELKGENNNEEK